MKKIGKVLVATSLLASLAFESCGGDKKDGAAKVKRSKDATYKGYSAEIDPATGKVYDFGGMEVTIYDWWTNPDAEAASTQQADQMAFRAWMEKTYNFKAVQKDLAGWANHPTEVANACITADSSKYAVYIVDHRSALAGLKQGFWADLSKTGIDWKKAKWDQGLINKLRNGDSFYTFGYGKPEPRTGVFFNKRILQENGVDPESLYDMQKDGTWTWAAFEEICAKLTKDTDNDGIIDQYAMASKNDLFGPIALESNNAAIISYIDGKFVNTSNSDNAMEAWNWTRDMFQKYQRPQGADDQWDYYFGCFQNGEVAFIVEDEYNAQPNGKFASMKDDYGFVCFPKGPKGTGKYPSLNSSNMWVIPSYYDDATLAKIAKIVDFYTEDVPEYDDPEAWKEGYWSSFRDERAVNETLQLMMDNATESIQTLVPDLNVAEMSWSICGGADPMETYETLKDSWQSRLDAVNK